MKFSVCFCLMLLLLSSCSSVQPKREKLLMHAVYLDVKEELPSDKDGDFLISELKKLSAIETTHSVTVGKKAPTGDPRLNSEYDIVLLVGFGSLDKLKSYSEDPRHLKVRANIKDMLAAAPVVYDWWEE